MTTTDDRAAARPSRREKYIATIQHICQTDPGARSALRSGLRRDMNAMTRMHRLIAPWLRQGSLTPDNEQRAYYAVAAMIADAPRHTFNRVEEEEATPPQPDTSTSGHTTGEDHTTATTPLESDDHSTRRYADSLGKAFATAVAKASHRERKMRANTAEARLHLLSRQSSHGLYVHLPASIRYLRELDVPIAWTGILDDLIAWPTHAKRISRRWLQDYYWHLEKAEREAPDQEDWSTADGNASPE